MALKADRYEEATDITFFFADTATRGGVAVHKVLSASGAAMDQGDNQVAYDLAATGTVPVGVLMNDVVNKDLTRTHLNQYKDEVQAGGKVTIMNRGWVVTNALDAVTIVPGEVAYASAVASGNITNVSTANNAIGRFGSSQDSDGYAKVFVNLPNA